MRHDSDLENGEGASASDVLSHPSRRDVVRESEITGRVAEIIEHRAVIEQVKGVLAVVYGISAEEAFQLLKWRSQVTNTKLRAFAEQLFLDLCSAQTSTGEMPSHATLDHILMTAHQRVGDTAQRQDG